MRTPAIVPLRFGRGQAARVVTWWRRLSVSLPRAVRAYSADNCSSFANAIAYNALLSLIPLVVFTLAFVGLFLQEPATQERVRNALLDHLPITTADGRAQLQDAISAIARTRPTLGIVSLVIAAWAARGLVLQLRTGLSVAFRIQRRRSLARSVLLDLAMAVGLGLLILLSLALTLGIAVAEAADRRLFGTPLPQPVTLLFALVYLLAPMLVSLLVFATLYRVVAYAVLSWRQVLPGALLAALAFEALKIGFAQYVARFGSYNTTFGSLGFVIVFLALPHFGAQIALFGAVFARVYAEAQAETAAAVQPAGHEPGVARSADHR